MKKLKLSHFITLSIIIFGITACYKSDKLSGRTELDFNYGWKFTLGDVENFQSINFNDSNWRNLDLPHDWSIEGEFDKKWASGTGFLPGGIGCYRKIFTLSKNKSLSPASASSPVKNAT